MLGGPMRYKGKPLATAHKGMVIRGPHFGRRQVLMREVLDELGLDAQLAAAWMEREEALRPLIVTGP